MFFSIIIPVFNRPDEVDELLMSLCKQSNQQFEVIIVEDGSSNRSDNVVEKYRKKLSINYHEKTNSGPGLSRNAGATLAKNDYLIFFDSDCIIPPSYIENASRFLQGNLVDMFGGPDAAMDTFTTIQKAINYSMTSFFTTGGIRGRKRSIDTFLPRGFNMGVSKEAFNAVGGYREMRFGEDIDLSLRIIKKGYQTALITEAYVYHKRRSTYKQFFKQIYNSGIARINLHILHPGSMKLVHTLPALFTVAMAVFILLSIFAPHFLIIPIGYSMLIFIDSLLKNKSAKVSIHSIASSWIQLTAYGTGFITATWKRLILKKGVFSAFEKKFYE